MKQSPLYTHIYTYAYVFIYIYIYILMCLLARLPHHALRVVSFRAISQSPICMDKALTGALTVTTNRTCKRITEAVRTTSFRSFPALGKPSPELTFLLGQKAPLTHMPPCDLPRPWSHAIPLGWRLETTRMHGSSSSHHEKRQVSKLQRRKKVDATTTSYIQVHICHMS